MLVKLARSRVIFASGGAVEGVGEFTLDGDEPLKGNLCDVKMARNLIDRGLHLLI